MEIVAGKMAGAGKIEMEKAAEIGGKGRKKLSALSAPEERAVLAGELVFAAKPVA